MMAVGNNPYSPDISLGLTVQTEYTYCGCCELRFAYHFYAEQPRVETVCKDCLAHKPNGSPDEVIAMLRDHEPRLRNWIVAVHEKADEQEARIKELNETLTSKSEQVAAALESRNR